MQVSHRGDRHTHHWQHHAYKSSSLSPAPLSPTPTLPRTLSMSQLVCSSSACSIYPETVARLCMSEPRPRRSLPRLQHEHAAVTAADLCDTLYLVPACCTLFCSPAFPFRRFLSHSADIGDRADRRAQAARTAG